MLHFCPLNKVNAKVHLDNQVLAKRGVIDYALNLIKFNKEYESIFNLIFGDLLVIERIEDAKSIGIGNYKMVSLDGDFVSKSGAMSGGFKSRKNGVGILKDDKLEKKAKDIENRALSLKSALDHLQEEKESTEKELYDLRHHKIEVEGEIAKLEKLLSIEGRDISTLNSDIENILSDKTVIENSLKKIDKDINQLNPQIEKLNSKKNELKVHSGSSGNVIKDMSQFEEQREKLREKLSEITSEIDTRNIQIKNVLTLDINQSMKNLSDGRICPNEYFKITQRIRQ